MSYDIHNISQSPKLGWLSLTA